MLLFAHGQWLAKFLPGTVFGLPLALVAFFSAVLARRHDGSWNVRCAWWLSWFTLVWDLGWWAFAFDQLGWPASTSELNGLPEVYEYLLFFGPSMILSTCAVLVVRRPYEELRRRKSALPKCSKCGYDLTGLTVARCPECGRPFEPALVHQNGPAKEGSG
jgi:hypothetical protein